MKENVCELKIGSLLAGKYLRMTQEFLILFMPNESFARKNSRMDGKM